MKNFLQLVLATVTGLLLGLFLAISINAVLIQVSVNAFFNVYYGLLFLVVGTALLVRIN
jgi:high-affinity Fe2+/Pb2+ permease